jgi:hypothetical protein
MTFFLSRTDSQSLGDSVFVVVPLFLCYLLLVPSRLQKSNVENQMLPRVAFFTSQTESVRDIHSQIRNDFFLSRPDLHSLGDSALRYVINKIRSDLFLSGPDLLSLGDSVL